MKRPLFYIDPTICATWLCASHFCDISSDTHVLQYFWNAFLEWKETFGCMRPEAFVPSTPNVNKGDAR
jgi:hypothetical protein